VSLPTSKYQRPEDTRSFYRALLERVREIPGVTSSGAVSSLPLSGDGGSGTTTMDTTTVPPDKRSPEVDWRPVLPGYFETMGIRLIRGRFITDQDTEQSAPVAVIDETLARQFWPGEDPIGKRLHRGGVQSTAPWMTIVGVVGHVRYRTLEAQSRTELYWPELQAPRSFMSFVIRTRLDAASLRAAVEKKARTIDPDQPIYGVRTMDELMANSIARRKLATVLLLVFAAIAVTLAMVGVYGLTAYSIAERTQELGIRMALGANPGRIVLSIVGQSVGLAIAGVAAGLAGAAALARLVASQLYDTRPGDPLTYAAVSMVLLAVAAVAAFAPARRAARIDPAITLRAE
jgi:predicted permease